MKDNLEDSNTNRTIEPSVWQIMIQPMIAEYQALWTEMNNCWTQQQQLINMSWTVLAVFVAINQFIIQNSSNGSFDKEVVIPLILLIPLSLSILCLVFLRNEDKNWRIVAYIYKSLRPNIRIIYKRLHEYYQFNEDPDALFRALPDRIWDWGSYEMDKAFERKWKEYLFHPWLDLSRYALMIIPSVIVILQAFLKFRDVIFADRFTTSILYFDVFLIFVSVAYCIITIQQFRDLLGKLRRQKS